MCAAHLCASARARVCVSVGVWVWVWAGTRCCVWAAHVALSGWCTASVIPKFSHPLDRFAHFMLCVYVRACVRVCVRARGARPGSPLGSWTRAIYSRCDCGACNLQGHGSRMAVRPGKRDHPDQRGADVKGDSAAGACYGVCRAPCLANLSLQRATASPPRPNGGPTLCGPTRFHVLETELPTALDRLARLATFSHRANHLPVAVTVGLRHHPGHLFGKHQSQPYAGK